MKTDFETITNNFKVRLFPYGSNPIHKEPVEAFYHDGFFYCDGTDPRHGPDYYFRDVAEYCRGYEYV